MHNRVVAQLLALRRQKEQDKSSLQAIHKEINHIMRATGSHNPLFQEAGRGIIFTQSFRPQDWRKNKKRTEPVLADAAFYNFWVSMFQPDIATAFMEALLVRINEMDIEEEMNPDERGNLLHATRREWDFGKEYEVRDAEPWCPGRPLLHRTFKFFTKIPAEYRIHTSMRAAVLNTIILLMFFHPINYAAPLITAALVSVAPDPLLERMDQWAWKGMASYSALKPFHVCYEGTMKENIQRVVPTSQAYQLRVLKFMKADPSQRLEHKALRKFLYYYAGYMGSKSAAIDNSLIGTGWIYLWLQQEVLNGNGQLVVAGICGALELIARERGEVLTPAKELQIMCLLTTLSGVVSLVHLNDENQARAEFFAALYAEWFTPIKEIGLNTAQMLWQEGKAPGSASRKRCAASDARFGSTQPSRPVQTSIHVVVNPKCYRSYNLQYLLNATPIEADGEPYNDMEYIHYARWRLILQMLRCCGVEEVVVRSEAHVPLTLSQQPPEFVTTVYQGLLLIMADAAQCPDALQAANVRAVRVQQVWDELSHTFDLTEAILPEVDRALINDLPTNRLNPLKFTTIQAEPSWQPNNSMMTSGSMGGLPRFSRTGAEDILFSIISRTVDVNAYLSPEFLAVQQQKGVKEVVKVLIGGGDGSLNYILQGFVNLHYFGEKLPFGALDQLDLRFYILPTGEVNSLATYVGLNDLWYDANIKRVLTSRLPGVPHVANPKEYTGDPLEPTQKQQARQHLHPDWHTGSPRNLLTKQVENYVLEADNIFKISIFNCDAWYHDGQMETYCTIPFFGRAEIGVTAALVSPVGERQLGQHAGAPRAPRPTTETISSLSQKVGFNLSITWTGLGTEGEELPQQSQKGRYLSFMVINVPKPHEHSLACEPWTNYMDFFVLGSTVKAVTDQQVKSLGDIAYWSRPGKANWVSVEAIRGMEEESPMNFDILVDGEVFGPFHRVTFSPCVHPVARKTNLKLPVVTYWPPEIARFK